jgi:hypothetical protein
MKICHRGFDFGGNSGTNPDSGPAERFPFQNGRRKRFPLHPRLGLLISSTVAMTRYSTGQRDRKPLRIGYREQGIGYRTKFRANLFGLMLLQKQKGTENREVFPVPCSFIRNLSFSSKRRCSLFCLLWRRRRDGQ